MTYEGIPYHRYLIRYTLNNGKRRRKVLYSPGRPWIADTVHRWIAAEDIDIKPGSNVRIGT